MTYRFIILYLFSFFHIIKVSAESLPEVYETAKLADYQYKAAESAYHATLEEKSLLRSALLPKISIEGSVGASEEDVNLNSSNPFIPHQTDTSKNKTASYSLGLTQSIVDLSAYENAKRGDFIDYLAGLRLKKAGQSLMIRTADAYLGVLKAGADLESALSGEQAFFEQKKLVQKKYDVGIARLSDLTSAEAALDSAAADVIVARNSVNIAFDFLKIITGKTHSELNSFPTSFNAVLDQKDFEYWLTAGMKNNIDLGIARVNKKMAESEYKSAKYEHLPKLVGGIRYTNSQNRREFTPGIPDEIWQDGLSASLTLSVPLYTGGANKATSNAARYRYFEANENNLGIEREVQQLMHSLYLSVIAGETTLKARLTAISSSEMALNSIKRGYEVGVEPMTDVLNAQRAYFEEKRRYATAMYEYMLSVLRLKEAAGLLFESDITQLNQWLDSTRKTNNELFIQQRLSQ